MKKTVTATLFLCLFLLGVGLSIEAQDKAISPPVSASGESNNREQDGLSGPVRRVRLETAQIVVKDGKSVEGRRELRGVATYDLHGRKIDSVAYPVEGSSPTGKEQYQYDEKGNIIEMVARGDDGSVLSKESYSYEFDELGNWKKMTTSVAVYENGTVSYEPVEVSYRSIAYYYGQAVENLASGVRPDASLTTNRTATTTTPTKVSTPVSRVVESITPVNRIVATPVGDNQAKNAAVKESSAAAGADRQTKPAGEGLTVTRPDASPTTNRTATTATPNKVSTPVSAAAESITPVNGIVATPVADNQAKNAAVKESSAATDADRQSKPAGDGLTGTRPDASSTTNQTATTTTPIKVSTPVSGAAESIGSPVSGIVPTPVGDNQARNAAAKGSSAAADADRQTKPAGEGLTVTSVAAMTPALPNTASAWNEKLSARGAEEVPKSAAISLPKPTAKTSAAVSSTEPSVENNEIKNAKRDEPSSTLISSTRSAPSSATETSGSSGSATSLYQEGLKYLAAGDHEQAVEAFNQSIRLNPNDAIAYVKLGLAYSGLRKYKEAVVGLNMAVRINPEIVDAEAYYQLGYSYSKLGKHKDALEAFKQALYVTRVQGIDKDEARARNFPTLGEIHYSLGLAYYNLARYREAIKELNDAVKLNPKFAEAYYGLGIAYISLRDRPSAWRQQTALISLNAELAKQLADALSVKSRDLPCPSGNILQCR